MFHINRFTHSSLKNLRINTNISNSVMVALASMRTLSDAFYIAGSRKAALERCNQLFNEEKARQRKIVGRIQKIEVRYLGLPEDTTLIMNRHFSTPYDCAKHLSEGHCKSSVLALVDGIEPWDMHRPLNDSCTLQLLNFTITDPNLVNKAFWRSCSFMLGAVLQNNLKDGAHLQLHSFPQPNIRSGSFVYDIVLGTQTWIPNFDEMRALSAEMIKFTANNFTFERLEIKHKLAMEMFKDFHYKYEQVPSILQQNQGRVIVYRLGNHIDISRGPMIASTGFLGKCTVVAVHKLCNEGNNNAIYRVQAVAIPSDFPLNNAAYRILANRAKILNRARQPNETHEEISTQFA